MASEEIQLTPAEGRLLRRTFQRYALPYLGGVLALAAWALLARPDPAPAEAASPLAEQPAFLALREEVEQALARLGSAGPREPQEAGAAARQLAAFERRIEQTARRLEALEAGLAAPGQSAAEPGTVLERLYQLEQRQDGVEQGRNALEAEYTSGQQSLLQRFYNLEQRFEDFERRVASAELSGPAAGEVPAAPAR